MYFEYQIDGMGVLIFTGDSGGRIKVQQRLVAFSETNGGLPTLNKSCCIYVLSKHLNSKTPDSFNLGGYHAAQINSFL